MLYMDCNKTIFDIILLRSTKW